ncbi:hypothetical protein L484_002761 [Morus notabilis]|uniref:Uncharacterized protein n=1 Tax=Morus notabilis TaxID=981085 RepID=W9RA89_9ROSA|nr:hypothetical protein L484_002761 [Morus notabilis]
MENGRLSARGSTTNLAEDVVEDNLFEPPPIFEEDPFDKDVFLNDVFVLISADEGQIFDIEDDVKYVEFGPIFNDFDSEKEDQKINFDPIFDNNK